MLLDLRKIKIEQNTTSTSTALAISKKIEKDFFFEDSDSGSSSSTLDSETVFELLEIKRFVRKPNSLSFTKKTCIQNLPLLICSFKKDFFKPSFLFPLINFMN